MNIEIQNEVSSPQKPKPRLIITKKNKVKDSNNNNNNNEPIVVAVLLLLNGDLESPTLPREMRLQDLRKLSSSNKDLRSKLCEEEGKRVDEKVSTLEDENDKEEQIDDAKGTATTHDQRHEKQREEKEQEGEDEVNEQLKEELDRVEEEKTVVIGRNNECTYVLDVPDLPYLLSRTHAKCVAAGDDHYIYDFKTTNGTYLNGKIIEKQTYRKMRHGDIVSFGGPANVLRQEKSMKNPFRFRYLRTMVARDDNIMQQQMQQMQQQQQQQQQMIGGVGKRENGVDQDRNNSKKIKMSTFPLVGKGVNAHPLTLGGGYDDEFVPIFSQGPSQEIDDYAIKVNSQNDGTGYVMMEKLRETFEEGLLKMFEEQGGDFARKFNKVFMNVPAEDDVKSKDDDNNNNNKDEENQSENALSDLNEIKMEVADESPTDELRQAKHDNKKKKVVAAAVNDDDFTQPLGGNGGANAADNNSIGSNEDDAEMVEQEGEHKNDMRLIAKLSRACANRIVPSEDAQHEMPPWIEHELRCPICREFLVRPHCVQGCGHVFCFGCIQPWLAKSKPCPLCRHKPARCLPPRNNSSPTAADNNNNNNNNNIGSPPSPVAMIAPHSYCVKQQLTPCHVHEKLLKMYVLKWLTPAQKLKRLNIEEEGKRVEKSLEQREVTRIQTQLMEQSRANNNNNDNLVINGVPVSHSNIIRLLRQSLGNSFGSDNNENFSQERSDVRLQFEAMLPSAERDSMEQQDQQEIMNGGGDDDEAALLQEAQTVVNVARASLNASSFEADKIEAAFEDK
jgi:pSer/pThr/pTyr-binding forkhead associated (FHA) protein